MTWQEARLHYPHSWVLIEAIRAHSENNKRIVEQLSVINTFPDAYVAMNAYEIIKCEIPQREYYVLHTDGDVIDITERKWLGIRGIR